MEVFRLQGGINVDINDAVNGLQRVQKEAKTTQNSLGTSLSNLGNSMASFGKKLTVGVSVPLIGVGGYFIKAASDSEEMQSKFDTVFKTTSKSANKWAEEYSKAIGRSNYDIKNAISNQADLMIGMGFTEKQALSLSKKYTQLALDLGSFNNVNDTTALEAMTKAMFGETEMAKQLGLNLNATTMEQSEYVKSLGKSWKEMTQAERAEAYYQEALKQSVNAIGDAERTSGSYANSTKRLKGEITNLAQSMGKHLLPHATKIVNNISKLVEKFGNADEKTQKWILTLGGIAIVIPPIITALGLLVGSIGAGITGFTTISGAISNAGGIAGIFTGVTTKLGTVLGALTGPIGIVVGAIGLFTVALVDAYKNNQDFRNKVNSVFKDIQSIVSNVMSVVKNVISTAWSGIKLIWDNGLKQILQFASSVLVDIVSKFTSNLNRATSIVRTAVSLIKAVFSGDFQGAVNIVNNVLQKIVNGFNSKMDSARNAVKSAIDKIRGCFNFTWSLPKLKLPHISITGKFSLDPPSVPKFGIQWYSKGAIFTKPTILGNLGVGDANNGIGNGPEAILPINHLRKYVREELTNVLGNFENKGETNITQNLTINSPKALDSYTIKRQNAKLLRDLATLV